MHYLSVTRRGWLSLLPALLLLALLLPGKPVAAQPAGQNGPASVHLYLPMVVDTAPAPVMPSAAACKLPEAAHQGAVGLGFPRYSDRIPATGTVRVKMIFVDFPDAQAAQTPTAVYNTINPGASQFFSTNSYGRLNFQIEPTLTQWYRMSKNSTQYGWGGLTFDLHRAYIQEAVNLATPDVNFAGTHLIVVIANPAASAIGYGPTFTGAPAWGGISADGVTIYNAITSGADLPGWGYLWLNHEAGHSLGLPDLYAFGGDTHRFVGGWDVMGLISGNAPEMLAYQRWLLGWLDDTQIYCQTTASQTVPLTAMELNGGIKAVMVPTGATSAVVVESRRALGYDTALTKVGVLVYTIDTAVLSGSGPIRVLPDAADKYQSVLVTGQQLTVNGVTIKVLGGNGTGDTVLVTK